MSGHENEEIKLVIAEASRTELKNMNLNTADFPVKQRGKNKLEKQQVIDTHVICPK